MLVLALLVSCLVGALLPGIGSELAVLSTLALTNGLLRAALIIAAAAAQTLGKLVVYAAAAAGARTVCSDAFGMGFLDRAFARSQNQAMAIVFASALTSIPPLYATTIICGAAHHGTLRFSLSVFVARTLRYAAVVALLDPVSARVLG